MTVQQPDPPVRPAQDDLRRQIQAWRDSFDQSFAEPRRQSLSDEALEVLGIRIASRPFALNLAELTGVMPATTAVPYPATAPGLLGLIGHRGQALPLYDLQSLVGLGTAARTGWWVVARAAPLALAFEGFDGQWRLGSDARLQQHDGSGTVAVRAGGALRPLIELKGLLVRVQAAVSAGGSGQTGHDKNGI